jgi:NAD(P)-dependent dehydrogenase (short-subunit alcohol dehydrogenase family)
MEQRFFEYVDELTRKLQGKEVLLASYDGEESDFVRFNRSAIRQPGSVEQHYVTLELIDGKRHAKAVGTVGGGPDDDRKALTAMLKGLRQQLPHVPEDPYLLYATEVHDTRQIGRNDLPDSAEAIEKVLSAGAGGDMVGLYASGAIYGGFANSLGQKNWYVSHSFCTEWCFYHQADKAVKARYAGFAWDDAEFSGKVADAAGQLEVIQRPPKTISPGGYRVYLAPAAMVEIAQMLSWGGFGLKAQRTKNTPLVVRAPIQGKLDDFAQATRAAVAEFAGRYEAYFERENGRAGNTKTRLDSAPRVVLVPGVGLFGLGRTARDAAMAADLAENTVRVVTDAEAIGRYEPLPESDLFALEYWSLEQAKLKGAVVKPLTGQVALVTGAGANGAATAKALAMQGAAVAVVDIDGDLATKVASEIKGLGMLCDVTMPDQVKAAVASVAEHFGGVDIVVSNAGAAWQGRIGEVTDETLRKSFELNFFAHQTVAQEAVRIMLKQGTGGVLLFNLSKQAVNPGANFGPYGLPKAATMLLMRQYALDYGQDGIRSNGVNADRIRSGLLTDAMIAERAKARGVSEEDYMSGNLLHAEVTAGDVAQAFVALALARKTTGHIETVDGGNIAAALR